MPLLDTPHFKERGKGRKRGFALLNAPKRGCYSLRGGKRGNPKGVG